MPFEMIGEAVEHIFDHRLVFDRVSSRTEPCEKGAAERIAREQPVQIAAHDAPGGAERAIRMAIQFEHWALESSSRRHPQMHFVAPYRHASRELAALHLREPFVAAEHGLDVEQPEPACFAGQAFAALRI